MTKIGEKKYGREIGKTNSTSLSYFIWLRCPDCGYERWVPYYDSKEVKVPGRCRKCSLTGKANWNWKGGRHINDYGYAYICLQPNDPYFCMTDKYSHEVAEHRYVMAKWLGRPLESWEQVHHKGTKYLCGSPEDKIDNREENLTLASESDHSEITILVSEVRKLRFRVTQLEAELTLLRFQLEETHINELKGEENN